MSGSRSRSAAATLAGLALLLGTVTSGAPRAGAQTPADASVTLLAQPVAHGPGDPLNIRVRIVNRGPVPLEGYQLVVGALGRVQTRSALHASYDLSASQAATSFPVGTLPDRPLGVDESIDVLIEEPVSSLVLLSAGAQNGVYPLKLTLQDTLGVTLDTVTTQLLFYEEAQETRLTIVPVIPLHDVPARGPDGAFHPDDSGRYPLEEAVSEGGWLTNLLDVVEEEVAPQPRRGRSGRRRSPLRPLHVGMVPSARLVEELADMADGYRRARDGDFEQVEAGEGPSGDASTVLRRLTALLEKNEVQTILAPYSFADLPTLTASEGAVARQMTEAAVVLRDVLGTDVEAGWIFAPGGRLDTESLQELPPLGAGGLQSFLGSDSLVPHENPDFSGCPVAALSLACPVSVDSDLAGSVTGYAYDTELQAHLVDLAEGADGRVAMQRFFGETAMIREESPGLERVVHVTFSTVWRPSIGQLRTLLRNVARAPWLTSATPAEGLDVMEERADRTLVDQAPVLTGQPPPEYFEEISRAGDLVEHYASIGPPPAIVERLRRNILVAAGRVWWDEREHMGIEYARETRDEVQDEFEKIGAVGAAETTLTSREGPIQFVVFNDTGYAIRVVVSLDARGDLEVDEPDRLLNVSDNQQTASYDVTARASGIFPITIRLQTPDGYEIQAPQTITVRSTEFNEVALGLTFGALAFLILFYLVRVLRRRSRNDPPQAEAT